MSVQEDRRRVAIENIKPIIDCGRFRVKRIVGDMVAVSADIFADGQDAISARIRYRGPQDSEWRQTPMKPLENDRWEAEFVVSEVGTYHYLIEGWIDRFKTWQRDLKRRFDAGQSLEADLLIGARLIEEASEEASSQDKQELLRISGVLKNPKEGVEARTLALSGELREWMDKCPDKGLTASPEGELAVVVDREKALFSTWYELFPRSCSSEQMKHGTLKDCERFLPEIAEMGFDVLYLPPIHPIGKTNRKGKNNVLEVLPEDVGSPWAIGSNEGGHKTVHPQLGTLEDFERFVKSARQYGMDIAMDLAFQCSPDHPYTKEHPEWFRWQPDGTIQYAENAPKKYEDIVPINFETDEWTALWEELKSIVLFWASRGILIFRADNPHTKPFAFWEWLIQEVKKDYPEVIFFSEAFTRPKVMYRLAKAGFTQSYTYFTWRNTKKELTDYLTELTQTEVKEYFRPNFWPNTPDILPEYLQYGGRPAFAIRLILAGTLASNYGIYGPAFELYAREAIPGKEEYLNSEKYEIKFWKRDEAGNLKDLVTRVNSIRKENPAFRTMWNLRFYEVDNDSLLFYGKATDDLSNIVLAVVNLDPFHVQSGWVRVPLDQLGIDPDHPYLVHDLLSDQKCIWQGERNFVELNPQVLPANLFKVRKRLKREADFDYFL